MAVLDRFVTEQGVPRFKPVNVTLNLNRPFIQQACFPFNSSFYRPAATVCFIADDFLVHLGKNRESRKPEPIWKQHLFQGSCASQLLSCWYSLVSARISFIVYLRTRSTVLWAPRPGPWTVTFFRFPKFLSLKCLSDSLWLKHRLNKIWCCDGSRLLAKRVSIPPSMCQT